MPTKIVLTVLLLALAGSCSTRPANPGESFELRRRAETRLAQGNAQADRGEPEAALNFLDEAFRLAVLADDSGLRIRAGLSRGNVLFSLGLAEEAAAALNAAAEEAAFAGNRPLLALSRFHIARQQLLGGQAAPQTVIESLAPEMRELSEPLHVAFGWTVIALAEAEAGLWKAAEASAGKSLAIHLKGGNFELAALDWFVIASVRSRSGRPNEALQALLRSMELDRRVENSWGLASSWRATGDVHRRTGNFPAARAAYLRAAEIFAALDNEQALQDVRDRLAALPEGSSS